MVAFAPELPERRKTKPAVRHGGFGKNHVLEIRRGAITTMAHLAALIGRSHAAAKWVRRASQGASANIRMIPFENICAETPAGSGESQWQCRTKNGTFERRCACGLLFPEGLTPAERKRLLFKRIYGKDLPFTPPEE